MEHTMTTLITHPLQPLTTEEIVAAVKILREGKSLSSSLRFISVVLKEPAKDKVKQFGADGTMTNPRSICRTV